MMGDATVPTYENLGSSYEDVKVSYLSYSALIVKAVEEPEPTK